MRRQLIIQRVVEKRSNELIKEYIDKQLTMQYLSFNQSIKAFRDCKTLQVLKFYHIEIAHIKIKLLNNLCV
jgi:hypothetical protein